MEAPEKRVVVRKVQAADDGHTHHAGNLVPTLSAGLRQARDGAVDLFGNLADFLARAGNLNRVGLAIDQLQAELVFEPLECLAHGGLRQVQACCGTADAAFPRNGEEGTQQIPVEAVVEVGVELGLAHGANCVGGLGGFGHCKPYASG